jgi:hypothetical protein
MLGLLPLQASFGVTLGRGLVGKELWRTAVYLRASYQKELGREASVSMVHTLSSSIQFMRSATLLCCGVSAVVISCLMPCSSKNLVTALLVYSPLPSDQRIFSCFPVSHSTLAMKTFSWSRRSDFNFSPATKTLHDLSSVKVAKYLNF